MPAAIPYIASFIESFGVEEAVAYAAATVLEYVAILEILNVAQQALNPQQKSGVGAGLESNYYNSEAPIRIIYGTVRVGGMQTIPPITYGSSGEYLAGVLTIAGHEVNDITDCYLDANVISDGLIGSITGAETDGLVSTGTYANLAWIRRYLGTLTQSVDFILTTDASPGAFTANFRGRGIAYVATQLKFDIAVFPSIPNQTYVVQGKKVYDPRLDSTQPGGSGTQRVATPSTWTFSSNPALCIADYLMAIYGGEYDQSEIDWATVTTAANVCDFVLTGASSTPDGDQPRYTCNGAMLATQAQPQQDGTPFTDNLAILVNSMLGRIIFANGIWSMFAGGWQTPNAVAINKSDWSSGLQFGFEQGRGKRFNEAHCWFLNPFQNWQRVECYPRINATYVTADGGEAIPFETDQPLCTVEKEAQRKAEFVLRQSRNQVTVSGKLPPRFQGIKLWDTINVNYDDFSWSNKTFRVAGCTTNPDGSFDVSLSEEQASDWNDLATAEYNNPSAAVIPTTKGTTPSTPGGFAIEVVNGTISFDWSAPAVLPRNTHYRIMTYTGSLSAVNSKQVLWQGDATHAVIQTTNNSPFYAQVQAYAGSDFSPYNPNTFGLQVIPNYSNIPAPASSWVAYLSGTAGKAGTTTPLSAGPLTAVVVSPTAPVYSWTLTSSPTGSITLAPSAGVPSVSFIGSMAPGVSYAGLANCHIVDGTNVASLSHSVLLTRVTA